MAEEKEETFEESFDVASKEDGKPEDKKEETEVTETTDTKVTEKKEGEDNKGKKEEKPEEVEHKYETLQGMFKKLSEDFESYKKEHEPKKEEKEDEKPKVEPKPEEEEVPDTELEGYLKEYDYIARNQEKLTTKALKKVLSDFSENFKKELIEKYDITIKGAEKLISEKLQEDIEIHIGTIMEAHPDYILEEEKKTGKEGFTRKEVETWVNTLSPIRKREYKAILEDGSTEEAIELLSIFKEANGIVTKKDENDEDLKDEKVKEKELKEKKLQELETVKHKKGTVGLGSKGKSEDFEGAFDEAISSQK